MGEGTVPAPGTFDYPRKRGSLPVSRGERPIPTEMKSAALRIIVFCLLLFSPAGAAPPLFLTTHISDNLVTVTWTNWSEAHLEESTNLLNWTRSTRPFVYIAARSRIPLRGSASPRFFRLTSTGIPAPPMSLQTELDRTLAWWPYGGSEVTLQSRTNLSSDWAAAPEIPQIVDGYKQLTATQTQVTLYFRLGRLLNHVLIIGQSLSIGGGGIPILSSNQPFANRMLSGQLLDPGGPGAPPIEDLSSIIPLVERTNFTGNCTSCGETIASGFANSISTWEGEGQHDLLVSNTGRGGAGYVGLQRGTAAYTRSTNQIAAAKTLCADLGYQFQAVFAVHGEGDSINQHYQEDIRQWQADYESDARMLSDQTNTVPMFHSQISAWGNLNAVFCRSPYCLLDEHEANPDKTVLVCPKYFLPYSDGLHLNSESYRWLGEYYAKAYRRRVIEGQTWSPLRPLTITRSNNILDVTFAGNVGTLVLDTNHVTDPRGHIYISVFGPSVLMTVEPENDRIHVASHTLQPGDSVAFHAGLLPGGLAEGLLYYVRSVPGTNSFELSATPGGPRLDLTTTGTNAVMYLPTVQSIGPFGFEYTDDDGDGIPWRCATTITDVSVTGTNRVRITLSKTPTGASRRLRYAYTALPMSRGGFGGPELGPRGCLRDSDPAPSAYGNTLHNWCVHFDKPVP